jgi:phosphate-selective porin
MSELSVGQIKGLPINNNIIDIPAGHTLYSPGSIVQTISINKTDTWSAATATPIDIPGMSISITPKLSTSKILLMAHVNVCAHTTTSSALRFARNGTPVGIGDAAGSRVRVTARGSNSNSAWMDNVAMNFLDSPETSSQITYTVQGMPHSSGWTIYVNRSQSDGDTNQGDNGRTISTLTVMEIAQ